MSDNGLLEKVIVSTEIGNPPGSGLLSAEQSNRFIDYMWDATVLAPQVRTIRLKADTAEIDRIGVGKRLIRRAVEAVDTGENQGVYFSKISLTTHKIRLDWELSTETLEDNLEGDALEDHIARLMATQAGTDLEDLAINGDTDSTDKTLKIFDGWRKLALEGTEDGAAHVIDNGGDPLDRAAFNAAIKAMPRNFMARRGDLKFFMSGGLIQDYLFAQTNDVNNPNYANDTGVTVPEGRAGFTPGRVFGIPYQEVNLFDDTLDGDYSGATGDHGEVWLTFPQNLIWAVKREIRVNREYAAKKDTYEYTMFTRVGVGVENTDAFVVVKNVKSA